MSKMIGMDTPSFTLWIRRGGWECRSYHLDSEEESIWVLCSMYTGEKVPLRAVAKEMGSECETLGDLQAIFDYFIKQRGTAPEE